MNCRGSKLMGKKKDEYVPSEPFARWLNKRLAALVSDGTTDLRGATIALAAECGWGAQSDHGTRKLYRLRKQIESSSTAGRKCDRPTKKFPRDTVEEALFCAGVPFEDIYPEIAAAEVVLLEPDEWCPDCREEVTPIDGHCAWCDWRLGPATGQRLQGRRLAA